MAYPGVLNDFRACGEGRAPRRMPLFALGLEFDQRMSGVTCREARLDVERVVQGLLEAVSRFDYDWAMVFPDDYVEFEPLGLRMTDAEDRPTMPVEYLPMERAALDRFPEYASEGRMPVHLEMIRRAREAFGDTVCVAGRIAAPFSSLGLVYGIEATLLSPIERPTLARENLAYFTRRQIAFGLAQIEAGADVLWLGDCVARSPFLSPDQFDAFAFEPAAEVAEALTRAGAVVIYHSGENSLPHLTRQAKLPAGAINVGEGVDLLDARRAVGEDVCLMGNFDPILLQQASEGEVADAAGEMARRSLAAGPYVFNTGEGVMQNTPPENVAAMLDAARGAADEALGWPGGGTGLA